MSGAAHTLPRMNAEGLGSVAAAVVAGLALVVAWLARRDSRQSAEASVRSAEAAERAAEITELEARRRVERSDVVWERERRSRGRQLEAGILRYQNVGSQDAFGVSAVLTINGERIELSPGRVPAGTCFEYDAREIHQKAKQARDRRRAARESRPGIAVMDTTRFRVSARISWQTELGTPGIVIL